VVPNLLLVPGLASDSECWRHQIDALTDAAQVSVVDLRTCRSRHEMADAVLADAPAKFILAGNSMGGWVAQEVAARAPDRVTSLILVATWTRADPAFNNKQREGIAEINEGRFEEVMRDHARSILHPKFQNDREILKALFDMQDRIGPETVARHIQAMIDSYETTSLLPEILAPTLVIAGRQDPLFSVEEHAFIARQVARGRLAIVEESGHVVQMEQPSAVTALMRYWIEYGGLDAGAPAPSYATS
jgi:pimeloyl-ACP methyl ester carboxylesterase